MNTISKNFPLHQAKAHRKSARSVWHDMGVGLAIVLTVLIMTVVGTRGPHISQTVGTLSGIQQPKTFAGWENSVPPELFPLGPVTSDAPM
jgi:hypothetical protein